MPLPRGVIVPFGSHRVFVAALPEVYPKEVRVFSGLTDPLPFGAGVVESEGTTSYVRAEVMMAGASSRHNSTSTAARAARDAANAAAATSDPKDVLRTPVDLNADPAV